MSLDPGPIIDAVRSHGMATALFERTATHEPKNAAAAGLTMAIWVQRLGPVPAASGLDATSIRLVLMVRLYSHMLQEPQDEIDPAVTTAVAALMTAYTGDFTLGGLVKNVDLLGAHGIGLDAQAGYLPQDGTTYRVMDITLPLIVNDAFDQEA